MGKVKEVISKKGKLILADLSSAGRVAVEAAVSALLLVFADKIEVLDLAYLGEYSFVAVGVLTVLVRVLRKLAVETNYMSK